MQGLAEREVDMGQVLRKQRELKRRQGRFWPANPWREKFTAQIARARRK